MKLIKLLALPALLLGGCIERQHEENIDKLQRFYTFYITEAAEHGRWGVNKDTLAKYCTKQFLSYSYADSSLDYDPVIWDEKCKAEWVKTLSVTKGSRGTEKEYRISYMVDKNYTSHNFMVILGKENKEWKIDIVKDLK